MCWGRSATGRRGDTVNHTLMKHRGPTFAVDLQEVGSLQGLEAKVLVSEVSVVYDGGVETLEGKGEQWLLARMFPRVRRTYLSILHDNLVGLF